MAPQDDRSPRAAAARERACDGCLGTAECWICAGNGCGRCASSGRCHLCDPVRRLQLIPPQTRGEAAEQPRAASAS